MVRVSLIALFQFSFFPLGSFVASLLGKTLDVRKGTPRKIEVLFKPPRAGTFQGTLKITFRDKARRGEKFTEFTVTRELHGHATLPTPASSSEPSNKADGDGMESERAGVTVSHGLGVEFSVERSRSDEPFDKLIKELVIKKNSVIPLVSFKEARVISEDKSGARCVYIMPRQFESHFLDTAGIPRGSKAILSGSSMNIKI